VQVLQISHVVTWDDRSRRGWRFSGMLIGKLAVIPPPLRPGTAETGQSALCNLNYGCLWQWTKCSAIAERPRCRVRYSFGQKWNTGTGRQYFTDIFIGLCFQPLWYKRAENLSNSAKKRKIRSITAFKVIQGHRGQYQSKGRMRLLISD